MVQALALHESQVLGLWRRAGEAEVSLLALPSLGQLKTLPREICHWISPWGRGMQMMSSPQGQTGDVTLGVGHTDSPRLLREMPWE